MNRPMHHSRIARNRTRAARGGDEWKHALPAIGLLLALTLAVVASRDAHSTTYKWVDDKGIVHYADKMPADAVNRGHVEFDRRGIAVKKMDPALTPEQVRARAAEVEQRAQAAKEHEETSRRDRALLASYTREDDIDLARGRSLTTIEGQMQSARSYSATLAKRQAELAEKKQSYGDKNVPAVLERELESVASELVKTSALMETKKQESLVIAARYDADKRRWRELQALPEASASATPKSGVVPMAQVGGTAPVVLTTGVSK
jgi:Domain of unknown function (DUF4124)